MTAGRIGTQEAASLALRHFGWSGTATEFPSYIDQNFRLDTADGPVVLKFAHADQDRIHLEFETAVLRAAASPICPKLLTSAAGDQIVVIETAAGVQRLMRVVSLLPGVHLADSRPFAPGLMAGFGAALGAMDRALVGFEQPGMDYELAWDLRHAAAIGDELEVIADPALRAAVVHFAVQFQACVEPRFAELRRSVIHNDANEHNVLVEAGAISGILDFGDVVRTCTVFNAAIAGAYLILDAEDPIATLGEFVGGYHGVFPLTEAELDVLYPSLCMRLCVSLVLATRDAAHRPDNEYITISQARVQAALRQLRALDGFEITNQLRAVCGMPPKVEAGRDAAAILALRERRLGPSLSVSYESGLKIVRGAGQYLFDDRGRGYIDCVNNVCHVGHCHPGVVAAAQAQIARLNTNTRYLHDHIVEYADRLTGLFPDPLEVCFFVCTGSEANELALRLAKAHTGRDDMVVVDMAYHGNTSGLIDLSPYKHSGPGGRGRPEQVHVAALPDGYRGEFRYGAPDLGERYAASVEAALARAADRKGGGDRGAAAFLVESMSGCAGQVEYPEGYLRAAFRHARAAGALCIADEVQVGFGRVGSHMWAFETQGVVPDIVTLGKPMGNGHPLAAVVTSADIAASLANGMEYFNTFGGNPVSCAIGLAVLDAIEADGLLANARAVGEQLIAGFRALQDRFPIIGDVRGRGLYLGVEMVRDRDSLEPAAEELAAIIERMKRAGFLLSTDGKLHNVVKIKPPMPFSPANAVLLLAAFGRVLEQLETRSIGPG